MQHVKVMLAYFHPWTNSAGFYIARERGWYRDADLDVEFVLQDPGRGDTLSYLSRGAVDFGIFPSNRLLVRREKGERIAGIAAINHRALETIQSVVSRGIRRPRDLAGRLVALNPTLRGLAMVRHLVEIDGGDPRQVNFLDTGTRELAPEDIANGEADASFGSYWAWEALMETSIPHNERIVWPIDELGAPLYHSYLLGTQDNYVHERAELVRQFVEATARGYLAVARDPEIAIPVYERIAPYFPRNLWRRSLPSIAGTWLHDGQWGIQREELLAPYAEWLTRYGILREPDIWKSAVTNVFLPSKVVA